MDGMVYLHCWTNQTGTTWRIPSTSRQKVSTATELSAPHSKKNNQLASEGAISCCISTFGRTDECMLLSLTWTTRCLLGWRSFSSLSGSTTTTTTQPFLPGSLIIPIATAATVSPCRPQVHVASLGSSSSSSNNNQNEGLRLYGLPCVKPTTSNIRINRRETAQNNLLFPARRRMSSSLSWPFSSSADAAAPVVGNEQGGVQREVLSIAYASSSHSSCSSTTADPSSPQKAEAASLPAVTASTNCWCCTAELRAKDETCIEITRLAGYPQQQQEHGPSNFSGSIHDNKSSSSSSSAKPPPPPPPPPTTTTVSPPPLDLTQASDWMEYMELLQVQQQQQKPSDLLDTTTTTDGAYDTLRCDLMLVPQSAGHNNNINLTGCGDGGTNVDGAGIGFAGTKNRWNIWGLDFHLDRLERSYLSLMHHHHHLQRTGNDDNNNSTTIMSDDQDGERQRMLRQQARNISVQMLHALLEEASSADIMKLSPVTANSTPNANSTTTILEGPVVQLVRLTWLWSATAATTSLTSRATNKKHTLSNDCSSSNMNKIVVRAHAVSSAQPISVRQPVKPITCTIAADQHHHHEQQLCHSDSGDDNNSDITVNASLPSRCDHPQGKVASWTRLRKKLENPETYKPAGVAEVLLVRPTTGRQHEKGAAATTGGGLELLEGLSSNLFVLYNNEDDDETPLTLRTAHDGVLHGYVRHLVLDVANTSACGIHVSHEPILLQDVHRWKEAFITSSSRLIVPISSLLLHDGFHDNDHGIVVPIFREFWRDPRLSAAVEEEQGSTEQPSSSIKDRLQQVEKPKWQELLEELLRRGGYD